MTISNISSLLCIREGAILNNYNVGIVIGGVGTGNITAAAPHHATVNIANNFYNRQRSQHLGIGIWRDGAEAGSQDIIGRAEGRTTAQMTNSALAITMNRGLVNGAFVGMNGFYPELRVFRNSQSAIVRDISRDSVRVR